MGGFLPRTYEFETETQRMDTAEIDAELAAFAAAFEALPEVSEPPSTTLEILRERTREKYWNRLLRYFLDPSAAHGFGSDFLEAFLVLAEERTGAVGLSDSALEAVDVESEVSSDGGRPDLLLVLEDEWFVCIELKVTAPETGEQTRGYANSDRLGELDVSDYSAGERQYVYLAKRTHSDPASERFSRLHWRDVHTAAGRVLDDARGRYPARSTAQLSDFRDTIETETMSDHPEDTQQDRHIELYLEHTDAIDTVRTAFERMVDRQTEEWATRFLERYRPEKWDEAWNCESDKYGKLFRDEWRRDENGTPVADWSSAAFRLEFRHRIRAERSWKTGTVTFRTVIPRNSDEAYRDRCRTVFNDHLEDLRATAESTSISIEGNSRVLTEATYSFEETAGPEGYYDTLADAFDEHVVLVPLLTEIYDRAYEDLIR